ncbi:MAG: hypothetical protein R3Y24_03405 [Eubacteriales bacterium]
MSKFTDSEHYEILEETLKWEKKAPKVAQEHVLYGDYQMRLKDDSKALYHYEKAWEMGDVTALYGIAICFRQDKETQKKYKIYYPEVFAYYLEKRQGTLEEQYRLAMCYAYGIGTKVAEEKAYWLFLSIGNEHGAAMYELGRAFELGFLGCKKNREQAMKWYRKSYDLQYEPAIFAHFKLFRGFFDEYPYQREIKEATSFLLGQLIRVATVSPCQNAYEKVIELYEAGYPGDSGEEKIKFQKKADLYRKQLKDSTLKYTYGKYIMYTDSKIYQAYLQKENVSGEEQLHFLQQLIYKG